MRLKSVKIFGFKTFAERTDFDIEGDLVAVVGPNGCGKSNLVDAILWGLGEGNSRHLRAQSGVDVIFNGSSRRKPVGYAEVSLCFDNSDGSLPIDTTEVVVGRKLTRSGDSVYTINRQTCRLRDVLDLLADSGLGRAGYSIVGQKEIDSALAASADDRRAWVDEAAGVQRYRSRKLESLRRLASAKDSLMRVRDILREVEDQREPLREEAEVARRFKVAIEALRQVECGLLIVEVAQTVREIEELEDRIAKSSNLATQEAVRAERIDEEIARVGARIAELESDMDSIRASHQSMLTRLERAEAAVQLGQQRLESFEVLEANLDDEDQHAVARRLELDAEVLALEKEAAEAVERFERTMAESSGAAKAANELRKTWEAIEARMESARRAQAEKLKFEAAESHRRARLKELEREWESAQRNLPDVEKASDEASAAWVAAQERMSQTQAAIEALGEGSKERQAELAELEGGSRKMLAEKATLEGRKRGIESTLAIHEGLANGPREVLRASQEGRLKGDFVPVGEAIETDREYAVALETALGGSANDLIVDSEEAAKRAVEFLKSNHAGRATFQPIPLMRPVRAGADLLRLAKIPEVIGIASDLVRCHSEHRCVIESLLGRVLIVDNLESAVQLAKTQGWSRLVTLDGEVVHHSGAVTGGRTSKSTYGAVQRKAELAEIEARLEEIDDLCERASLLAENLREAEQVRSAEAARLDEVLAMHRSEESDARQWAASVMDELNSTRRAIGKLEAERSELSIAIERRFEDVDMAALEAERDAAFRAFAAKSADAEQVETRIRELDTNRHAASERLEAARRRQSNATTSEQSRERRRSAIGPEREKVKTEIHAAQAERSAAIEGRDLAERRLLEAAERKRAELERSFELHEESKSIRNGSLAASEAIHAAEISRARAESKRANALQRLIEEYGLNEDDALEQEAGIELPEDASQATARLRKEIRAMGDVNVGAIEAYERLSQRAEELNAQVEDIESGIAEVESSIRELDKLTRARFESTYLAVKQHFSELFQTLFPGGEGSLELSDPENLLESGIEIDVQLPGKRKQRLELLSGGERSLCATAFLFSLLRAKPSPLVVLDEVDAPLDGRNVERFIELLNEFSKEIQFIVITHNPTTIAAAPVWLGVTMSEPGVSTLVPARVRVSDPPAMMA